MAMLENEHAPLAGAKKTLKEISQDKLTRLEYDKRQFNLMLHEKNLAESKAEGKAEVARQMKSEQLPLDMIQRMTGLSAEEIEGLH